MKRTKQLRLSHLLIVLALLTTLIFPGGTALAGVIGQETAPQSGEPLPEMPENMDAPVDVPPVVDEYDPSADNPAGMVDFAPVAEEITRLDLREAIEAAERESSAPVASSPETEEGFEQPSAIELELIELEVAKELESAQAQRDASPIEVPQQPSVDPSAPATTNRFVRPGYTDTSSCVSNWCGTIQYAIDRANAGDQIVIYPGTYREGLTVNKNLSFVNLAYLNNWSTKEDVRIDGEYTRRNVFVNPSVTASMSGIIIQNGRAASFGGGGIVLRSNAEMTLNSSVAVINNISPYDGGGIRLFSGSQLTLNGATITSNAAEGVGGGIYNDGGTVILDSSAKLEKNIAQNGGGIYNVNGGSVTTQGSATVNGNLAHGRDSLAAYWPFENNSFKDASGNGHTGILRSGANYYGPTGPSQIRDFSNIVLKLDRNNTEYAEGEDFDITDDFTIALWVNPSQVSTNQLFVGKHTNGGDNLLLFGMYSGSYYVGIRNQGLGIGTPTTGWQHIAVVGSVQGSGTLLSLYKNGVLIGGGIDPDRIGNVGGGRPWVLGMDWDGNTPTDYFDGQMDDVRIYNQALSASNISALAEGLDLGNGGGLYTTGGIVTLNSSAINKNTAGNGGGLYGSGSSANILMESGASVKENNVSGLGGGVYVASSATLDVASGASISQNAANIGGGVFSTAKVNLRGTISNNSADSAGGMYLGSSAITNFYNNATVTRNAATAGTGGGIYADNATLKVNGDITRNTSSLCGGGIYGDNSAITIGASTGDVGTSGAGNTADSGGGICANGGSVTIEDTGEVRYNTTLGGNGGGGIYLGDNSTLTLKSGAIVANNSASNGPGGGIRSILSASIFVNGSVYANSATSLGGGIYAVGPVTIDPLGRVGLINQGNTTDSVGGGIFAQSNVTVRGGGKVQYNTALGGVGGGIYAHGSPNSSTVTLEANASVNNNTAATNGGGIFVPGSPSSVTLIMDPGASIANNHATSGRGGGIYALNGGDLTLGGAITGNQSGSDGGGLWVEAAPTTVSGKIAGNSSGGNGGGVYSKDSLFVLEASGQLGESGAGNVATPNNGGGLYLSGGSGTIRGDIAYNQSGRGGGIYSNGPVTLSTGASINNNTASSFGGGIYQHSSAGELTLSVGAEIRGNSAGSSYNGGGVYVTAGTVQVDGTIAGNSAGYGGGIYANSTTVTLGPTGVVGQMGAPNRAIESNAAGGGMYLTKTTAIISGTISYNESARYAGGIRILGGTISIQGASIHHNSATYWGGGLDQTANSATVSIINTTISNNSARFGGGIFNQGVQDLKFVTLAKNSATSSGANVYNFQAGQATIFATILAGPQLRSNCTGNSLLSPLGFNRISDNSCLTTPHDDDLVDIPIDLGALLDNGGTTLTHLPNSRSANVTNIVDIMPAATCASIFAPATATDQRGESRPILGLRGAGFDTVAKCDAGAVELGVEIHFVCGPPLTPIANNQDRCAYTTIAEALGVAQDGDTVVISGVVTERSTINVPNLTIRGPRAWEITPGAHMGFVQTGPTMPTTIANADPIFTIPAGIKATIEDLNIRNGSSYDGGAIKNEGDLDIIGVTISQSRGGNGGAVFNSGALTVTNSTLISNTANVGGGIFNAVGGTAKVNHVTFSANTASGQAGAIWNQGTPPIVTGSIIQGDSNQCRGTSGSVIDGGFNMGDATACQGLTPVSTSDPLLGPLRDNGGPTLTLAITDAASPAATEGQPEAACTVDMDQRGQSRPLNLSGDPGGKCDIGAVEFGAAKLTLCQNCSADPTVGRFIDLQSALNAAMAGDVISIEAGAYTGNFTLYKDVTLQHAGIDITGLSQEQPLDVRAILQASELTITEQNRLGQAAGTILTVQGYALNPSTGALLTHGDVSVTLRGLTLRNGLDRTGGAIVNMGSLAIYTSTIAGNAAINNYASNGDIINDEAAKAKGGAIYSSGSLLLDRSTLSGNISEYYAGAIYVDGALGGPRATVDVLASTLADNRAARLPDQHLAGVNDDSMVEPTLTVKSGDEIRFESRSSQAHTLDVSPGTGVTCQVSQIVVPLLGVGPSTPLICTVNSPTGSPHVTVTDSANSAITLDITVQSVGFVPVGHLAYAQGNNLSEFANSILAKSAGSGDNCAAADLTSRFRSAGYNLSNDTTCQGTSSQSSDMVLAGNTLAAMKLGPLQDNNSIDFQAETISGYTYAHALAPDSPAIDAIPHSICQVSPPLTVNLASTASHTLSAGDTVRWRFNRAATVVFNDGENTARFVAVPASGPSEEVQFSTPGAYPYRAYDDVSRAQIAAGVITVDPRTRLLDQRGLPLPQRGTTRVYNCDMGAVEFQPWIVGQAIPRPPIALGGNVPEWTGVAEPQSYHLWSSATSQDFALRPTPNNGDADLKPSEMVTLKWETSTDTTLSIKIDQKGIVEWPDDPQLHIAQVPVNFNHEGVTDGYLVSAARAFEGRISKDAEAGTILSLGVFTRTLLPALAGDSYSVIQLVKGSQSSAGVKILVVKSVDWNTAGIRDMRAERALCTIGTELTYAPFTDSFGALAGHSDPQNKAGWILSGAAFDGVMTEADLVVAQNTVDGLLPPAFVRATREGPIIPILQSAPTTFANADLATGGHDLEVAWYRPDERNVAWPVRSVGYRCEWPTDPPQIVIASELGSEIAGQPVLDSASFSDITVYHQTDTDLPGFSPNWEHALLSTSNMGNAAPAFYALRTDLYDRDTAAAGDQSYALLKYRDVQDENKSKIGVYGVVLTRGASAISPVNPVNGTVTILAAGARSAVAADGPQGPLATSALTVTVRAGSGDLPADGTLTLPVEVIGVKNLHAVTATLAYDPARLTAQQCLTNRLIFIEAPAGLSVISSSPTRPGFVVKLRADLAAGTDVSYAWNFGDGSTRIAGAEVSTVYAAAGAYTVSVTATNGAFAGITGATSVVVADDAVPGVLAADQTTGCRIADYLFNVDKETYRFDLNSANIPDALVKKFAAVGVTLSTANVSLNEPDSRWQISSGGDLYTLIQRGELIHVYTGDRAIEDLDILTFLMQARNKHGSSGALTLADVIFAPADGTLGATQLTLASASLAGPDYSELKFNITAGNPVFAPTPMRSLLDIQICPQSKAADVTALPFWKDFKGALWARAAGDMNVLYFYPLQPGFYLSAAHATEMGLDASETARIGQCVPWMDKLDSGTVAFSDFPTAGSDTKVLPVAYHADWPELPPLLTVGETVYERSKAGVSGVANQAAVTRIYDDMAPGVWNNGTSKIEISGPEVMASVAQIIDPVGELSVPMELRINDNFSLPTPIKTQRLLFGGGLAIVGTVDNEISLPFALRSRISYNDNTGQLVLKGYYDGASSEYIKGDPLLLLNVLSVSDKTRLESLCTDGSAACTTYLNAVTALYHLSRNPRQVDLCRDSNGLLYPGDTAPATNQAANTPAMQKCTTSGVIYYRDGAADQAFLISVQDVDNNGQPEPYEGLGKGKALSAGNAAGTGFITLAYNNDDSLGGLPVSLQVIQVGCTLDAQGEDSTYRGNLLTIKSDNLFDEKLTLRHTGDFGGQPDNFTFEWYIAEVDDTGVSPTALPSAYPWKSWTKIEPGASKLGPEITIEGANPTTLSDNWLIARYKGYAACGNQVRYSAFAGDPSAKPSEVRAQLAQGWIKRVTNALNPFDARVDDFVSAPVNSTVSMIRQAGKRYEGPVAMNADPDNLNNMGLIEAYETVLDRGRVLSIDSNINHQGANAALLNVTSRIADLYMLLGGDAYNDALDPTVGLGTDSVLGIEASSVYAFMNQFSATQFGLIDEELALLRGRDETLGGVAAAPTYNRLTWNFTNGTGEVAYVQNYNVKDWNEDGFVNEADGALMYPQGHGDAWGQYLTAIQKYYELLRHPNYTWSPRAEPISVAGAPVVVDYYDESRFAVAAANKAKMGAEIVDLTYRKYYADPDSQPYIDTKVDASDGQLRAWGLADWAVRAGQGAYFDWIVANAILAPEDDRFQDVRKIDRTTVLEIGEISTQYQTVAQALDDADNGVNPLGLLPNALLFDLDPALIADGETHFEQIYQRAITSLDITSAFFDYANQAKVALRESQNEQRSFTQDIVEQDQALINDLIELFGYPYDADIGINGTYPDGYEGPDIYNYELYDRNALTDAQKRCNTGETCPAETTTFLVGYTPLACLGNFVTPLGYDLTAPTVSDICPNVNLTSSDSVTITYQVGIGLDAGRGRFKPASWPESSARTAPGEIQNSLQALTEARLNYEMAILAYENHVEAMESMQTAIRDRYAVLEAQNLLMENHQSAMNDLDRGILAAKEAAVVGNTLAGIIDGLGAGIGECIPRVFGLATGAGAPAACAPHIIALNISVAFKSLAGISEVIQNALELSQSVQERQLEIDMFKNESDFELRQLGREMQEMIREERELRLALFMALDQVGDAQGGYDQTRQRAFRTLQTLIRLRQRWAGQITEQRYGDMAYRIFQTDALQKYRKQFDVAQVYTYLTAAAYDYETNLAGTDPASGDQFLREIVGLRSLGGLTQQDRPDGTVIPIAGMPGLADPLARMRENFVILKGQMGFNNPQPEAKQFSLRQELFRLRDDSDAAWRQELARYYTPNIYANDSVARLAKRPFGESGPTPGFVIPFDSVVKQGLNYFGLPLGGGDNTFNPTQFTTKISAAGIWLEGYDSDRLSASPYVYLLPGGRDVMRPKDTNGVLRYWNVAEQLLPIPYTLGQDDLANPAWIPSIDGLNGTLYDVKTHAAMAAFPYTEDLEIGPATTSSRLIGRSVWNSQWMLVIPGPTLLADPDLGIDYFIEDVTDILLYFEAYSYAGTVAQ